MEKLYSSKMDELSSEYENKMASFETEIKGNMDKLAEHQGTGLLKKLLKIERFREEVRKQGADPDTALSTLDIECMKTLIEAKDREMEMMEKTNGLIDKEVESLSTQMSSLKELLEGMAKERAMLRAQNLELQERLTKARGMLRSILNMSDDKGGCVD